MADRRPPYDQNETPDDVATLYSWANLHGAKYRDFSASRAQTREQVRLRVQQALEAAQGNAQSPPEQSTFGQRPFDQTHIGSPVQQPAPPIASYPESFVPGHFQPQPSFTDVTRIDPRSEGERAAEVLRMAEAARAAEESRQAELLAQYTARKAAEQVARQAAEQAAQLAAEQAAQQQAEQAAREATEQAAKQAAEEAERQTAELAAKQAAEEADRQAAELAAKQAAEEADRQAAELAAKQAAEEAERQAAELAAKQAAEEADRQAAELAAKQAAEEADRQAAEPAAKQAAEEAERQAAELAAKQAAEEADRQAAELAAKHAAEEADRQAAELAAKQAAEEADRQAAELAAKQAAEEADRQAAELAVKQAAEEVDRQTAELAAKHAAEEADRQAAELAAKHAAEEADRQAAELAAKHAAEEADRQAAELTAKHAAEEAARRESERTAELAARQSSERAVHEAALQAEAARQSLAAQWAAQRAQATPPQTWPALHSSPSPAVPAPEPAHAVPAQVPLPPFDYPAYAQAHRQKLEASQAAPASLREEDLQPQVSAWGQPPFQFPLQPLAQAAAMAQTPVPAQATTQTPVQPPIQAATQTTVRPETHEPADRPAWLTPERPEFPAQPAVPQAPEDTLQGSRDRLTSRWYALRGVFDSVGTPVEAAPAPAPARAPVVAIFSLAGGVGKTSFVATMGRALSSRGERVLLVDTAAYGLLPFFFGAHDQRPGQLRTFSPPGTSTDAPIQMVTIDPDALGSESTNQEALCNEIGKYSRGVSRVIVDLATASGATTRRILRMAPLVIVPMMPDMNSVVSVSSIDSFFQHNPNPAMKSAMPYYVLNQFDASLPLHLDIREVMREQLGDRLLPFVVRRTPAVSEALAEGMTVMDYAPNSTVAEDFGSLAGWVKTQSAPASSSYRGVRWSER